ncbi:hypothetical protein [Nesterenkonia jeotgali]|uniref:Uncharacterized protein n=1 Tax=Nesterenkonia jeotgali TaxID=317018 RepID=A0A839FKS0_9MICC|nr:hypothetical protein [Nesterenkonia jeotgali]MBA8920446.1 hypothetical protein [Nesterenkonia jeotgali]
MQEISGYPDDIGMVEPTALVLVNGSPVEVSSLSVSRELSSSMPSQVASASGLTAATGSVSWAVGEDVQTRSAHPWDGNDFPPKPADEVVAFMGYGEAFVRQLTGSIDDSQGSAASGDVSSGLVDAIDKLNRPVSFPALLDWMPPRVDGEEYTRVGMQPVYITDRILRECGFNATPPQVNGCVFSAPHMGSAWPEVGDVYRASEQGFSTRSVLHVPTVWGVGLSSGDVLYEPDFSKASSNGRLNRTMQITVKVNPGQVSSGEAFVRAQWGGAYVSLSVTNLRTIRARLHNGSSVTTVCQLTDADVSDATVFTLRVLPDGSFTIFANTGKSTSGSASLPSAITGSDMDRVRVFVTHECGLLIGGTQVNFGSTSVFNAPQTARLTPPASWRQLHAFPRVESRNALDLLKEQAEAECAAMWIDEHGVFRWVNRTNLTGAGASARINALDDVLDIGWESSAAGVRSRVVLKSLESNISRSKMPNQMAWQAGGKSLEAGESSEEIVSPAGDADWVRVDEDLKVLPGDFFDFNRGRGTWGGGIASNDDGSQWATIGNSAFSVSMEKLADAVYKITTNAGSPPNGRTVELSTPDEDASTGVWKSKRNVNLPMLRAKGVVEWSDRETVGLHVGPQLAAVLEHDVGPWVQNPTDLQDLADWLSAQVFEPKPVLRNLSVIPDFRRQLGDVVWVEDRENLHIELKLLITKIDTTISAGSADQTIGGRILEARSLGTTNAQLDTHAGYRTNTGFDILWADATNAQLDTDPLGRG